MPVAKAVAVAAAVLVALAGAPREFGIGGGAVLCVPEDDIDPDATLYTPDPKQLTSGSPAFAFQFAADQVRRDVPKFSVDPRVAEVRSARLLQGSLGFVDDAGREKYASGLTCRREALRQTLSSKIEFTTCSRIALIDGFLVGYEIQQANAPLVPDLDRFLKGKIAEWRANCHATDRM